MSSAGTQLSPQPMSRRRSVVATGWDGCETGIEPVPVGDSTGVGSIGGRGLVHHRDASVRYADGDCFDLDAVSGGVEATGDVASLSLCAMVGLSVEAGGDLGDRRGDLLAVFGL